MTTPPIDSPNPKRVLLIKPSALGDVITAIPVLRGLRRTFPDAHIAWLISDRCAPLVREDSQLDEVILFKRTWLGQSWRSFSAAADTLRLLLRLRASKFDWVIDLQGLLRSGLFTAFSLAPLRAGFADAREGAHLFYTHRIDIGAIHTVDRNISLARHLGIDARPEDLHLEVSAHGRQFIEALSTLDNLIKPGRFLVCAPATTWRTKAYPVRHWRAVVASLSRRIPVVLVVAASERNISRQIAEGLGPDVIDLGGKTTVDELAGLISVSSGVICSDSAVKFIAPAVGVDSVTLIGPTRVEFTGPYLRGEAIVSDVPCKGCMKHRCRHITCMQLIDPDDVISSAETMLNGHKN